jgi:hypothetical protein
VGKENTREMSSAVTPLFYVQDSELAIIIADT